jgi:hypothetical protein
VGQGTFADHLFWQKILSCTRAFLGEMSDLFKIHAEKPARINPIALNINFGAK